METSALSLSRIRRISIEIVARRLVSRLPGQSGTIRIPESGCRHGRRRRVTATISSTRRLAGRSGAAHGAADGTRLAGAGSTRNGLHDSQSRLSRRIRRQLVAAARARWDLMRVDALEYWTRISFLKGGNMFSGIITTVSPRYAEEIQTPELGFGFDGILRSRTSDLVGILNGIDYDQWDPERDLNLPVPFSASKMAEGGSQAKGSRSLCP